MSYLNSRYASCLSIGPLFSFGLTDYLDLADWPVPGTSAPSSPSTGGCSSYLASSAGFSS